MAFLFLINLISVTAQDLVGIWLTTNGESRIQIYTTSDGLYQGELIWTKDQSEAAGKFHGSMILTGFEKESETVYRGNVHDPEKNNTYSCTITMKNDNELDLRGYIGIPLFGRTEHWTRVIN